MKKILLLQFGLLFVTLCLAQDDSLRSNPQLRQALKQGGNTATTVRFRCYSALATNEPLFVIDGIPCEGKALKELRPEDIERIYVLKTSEAMAIYGYRAASGVIIVTTKSAKKKKLYIKDSKDGSPLVGATVTILPNRNIKDTLSFIADKDGTFSTDQIRSGKTYELVVSSVGYTAKRTSLTLPKGATYSNILLERSYAAYAPVTVVAHSKAIRCGFRCVCVGVKVCRFNQENKAEASPIGFLVYPNPSASNRNIRIELKQPASGELMIELLTVTGQLVSRQIHQAEIQSLFALNLPGPTPGTYMVRVMEKAKGKFFLQKLIIQ